MGSTRKHRRQRRHVPVPGYPHVVSAPLSDVLAAAEAVDPDLPWEKVSRHLVPVFPRRRALPAGTGTLLTMSYPPGLAVHVGVDIGPAFLYATTAIAGSWPATTAEVFARALLNLDRHASGSKTRVVLHERIGDVPVQVFQSGDGWASALLLLPTQLEARFGTDPQLLLAPVRDVLISLPADTDVEFAEWLFEEFAAMDPNALDLPILELSGGAVHRAGAGAARPGVVH